LLKNKQGNRKVIEKVRDICSNYASDNLLHKCLFRIAYGVDKDFLAIKQQLSTQTVEKTGLIAQIKSSVSSFFKEKSSDVKSAQLEIPESLKDRIMEMQEPFNPSHYL